MEKLPDENGADTQQEEEKDFVNILEATKLLKGGQTQYISYLLEGIGGRPNLGDGLRYKSDPHGNYHQIRIHKDDIPEFVSRVQEYYKKRGI